MKTKKQSVLSEEEKEDFRSHFVKRCSEIMWFAPEGKRKDRIWILNPKLIIQWIEALITKKLEEERNLESLYHAWNFYRYMVDNLAFETSSFIIAYGLDNKEAYDIAIEEKVPLQKDDIEEFYKDFI